MGHHAIAPNELATIITHFDDTFSVQITDVTYCIADHNSVLVNASNISI